MDLQLNGRCALVSGASQGIGRAIALGLAREGVRVAMVARRKPLLQALAGEIVAAGGAAPVIIEADFYPENASEDVAARALQALGRVDILINAAGGSRPITFEASKEQWHEGMTLNFWRLRELTHAIVPSMKQNRFGRIVNLTGTSEPKILNAAFSAKAAVHVWAKGLSRELAPHNITINSLQPGRIRSEQIDKRYPTDASRREFAQAEIPAGRFGEADEIAHLAIFLASALAGYVTGTVIPVDGGMSRFAF
ncbi:MAG: SDR family oxidoreductase [Betaproteobacteria bacterium]|nr:SDR family oxidoreductase [Betaproteobacteria bacterium]